MRMTMTSNSRENGNVRSHTRTHTRNNNDLDRNALQAFSIVIQHWVQPSNEYYQRRFRTHLETIFQERQCVFQFNTLKKKIRQLVFPFNQNQQKRRMIPLLQGMIHDQIIMGVCETCHSHIIRVDPRLSYTHRDFYDDEMVEEEFILFQKCQGCFRLEMFVY